MSTAARRPPGFARRLLAFWRDHVESFTLGDSGTLVVGRGRDADIRVDDLSVSRAHARLHLGRPFRVEDMGSANGTRVGPRTLTRGQQEEVAVGAVIELGDLRLVPCAAEPEAASESPMARVRALVQRVAASDVSVLLVGETGAGKEVLAEEIHRASPRGASPFVRLNCAALPPHLLESELFGYERGAFTGATQAKPGLLESAAGGTVLFDEVAEMPALVQAKLLRVIETREVLRVGALRARPLDVRFVSATHRDPAALVVLGQFRQDLLFRLDGMTITVPPLRERASEVPELARALLAQACARNARAAPRLSPGAALLLGNYRWPGNVRELKHVLERALLLCDGDTIDVAHLRFGGAETAAPAPTPSAAPSEAPPPPLAAPNDERERIERALRESGGNQKEAARILGISRRVLMYRLDKLGVARPRKRGEG